MHLLIYMHTAFSPVAAHEKTGYLKLKDETLDHTLWRTRFGRGYGPVVRLATE